MIRTIFISNQHRLRCGWRILLQFAGFFILLIAVDSVEHAAEIKHSLPLALLSSFVYLAGIGGMAWLFARGIDRRSPRDYGFRMCREWRLDFGVGFLLGAGTLTAVFAAEWGMGWLRVTSLYQTIFTGPFILAGIAALLSLLAVGVGEEFTFRGYQIKNLAECISGGRRVTLAPAVALLITAVIFGVLHMANPNATLLGGMNVVLAGLLLGWAYLVTGELALPIGLHFGWGFFEEFVYGFANSGQTPLSSLIGSEVEGPDLWTGGAFGPEAGLLITPLILVDALLLSLWVKSRGRWQGIRGALAEYAREQHEKAKPIPPATGA